MNNSSQAFQAQVKEINAQIEKENTAIEIKRIERLINNLHKELSTPNLPRIDFLDTNKKIKKLQVEKAELRNKQ